MKNKTYQMGERSNSKKVYISVKNYLKHSAVSVISCKWSDNDKNKGKQTLFKRSRSGYNTQNFFGARENIGQRVLEEGSALIVMPLLPNGREGYLTKERKGTICLNKTKMSNLRRN